MQMITGRCTPTGGLIDIKFTTFMNCFCGCDGAAVYVSSDSLVLIRSDSFSNCVAGTHADRFLGGCACPYHVKSGSILIDSCAVKCGSFCGSLVCLIALAEFTFHGLSLFKCSSAGGAVCDEFVQVSTS